LETIRGLATRRWSIERLFKERETYLGLGHYELRGWDDWRRRAPLVFIAHVFGNKPRRWFSVYIASRDRLRI
jgi:SRSO17 transposase